LFAALSLLLACARSNTTANPRPESQRDVVTGQSNSADSPEAQQQLLLSLKRDLGYYTASSPAAINYRRFVAEPYRTQVFTKALDAYRCINYRFPGAETVEGVVAALEQSKLLPFWPVDPETRTPVRFVSSEDQVAGYTDLFVRLGHNGTFDYTVIAYDGTSPEFSPVKKFLELSDGFDNTEQRDQPSDPGEVFTVMILGLYMDMIQDSFLALGGRAPVNLDEVLGSRLEIHQAGWGSPGGAINSGQLGDFEFGVIPDLQAYYWDFPTSSGKMTNVFQFYKSKIAGEEIYDFSSPGRMIRGARPTAEQWAARIPLLTDELFAGPPPQH